MKKIIVLSLVLIMSVSIFSQQTNPSPTLTKQDYLKKARDQNTSAWFLTGGGIVLISVAGAIQTKQLEEDLSNIFSFSGEQKKSSNTADVLGYTGIACVLGSIPLFIAAHKNKKKAMSLSFKNETAPQLSKQVFVYKRIPSLSLKINL